MWTMDQSAAVTNTAPYTPIRVRLRTDISKPRKSQFFRDGAKDANRKYSQCDDSTRVILPGFRRRLL